MPGKPASEACPDCRPGAPCPKHCGANNRQRPGTLCQQTKGHGTDHPGFGHCDRHGGDTPNGIAFARKEQALALVATYGGPVDVDAHEALSDLIDAAYGHVMWLGAAIASSGKIEEVPPLLLQRYDTERILLARMAKDAISAGIAERQVRLAEDQGRQLAQVLRDVLSDVMGLLTEAGVSLELLVRLQREDVPGVVRRRLGEIMGGAA